MRRRTVKSCQCCGAEFWAGQPWARWCSSLCRKRAYERRRRGVPEADWAANAPSLIPSHVHQPNLVEDDLPTAWSLPLAGTEERFWHGTAIQRRRSDGFVNATQMAKANGKHLPHYMANERTREYLEALSGSVGIPTHRLVVSTMTGPNDLRGTWIHPRLAVDLARWISPAFAVWMDGWFLESLARPAQAPLPSGIHLVADNFNHASSMMAAAVRSELMALLNNEASGPAPQFHYHLRNRLTPVA